MTTFLRFRVAETEIIPENAIAATTVSVSVSVRETGIAIAIAADVQDLPGVNVVPAANLRAIHIPLAEITGSESERTDIEIGAELIESGIGTGEIAIDATPAAMTSDPYDVSVTFLKTKDVEVEGIVMALGEQHRVERRVLPHHPRKESLRLILQMLCLF